MVGTFCSAAEIQRGGIPSSLRLDYLAQDLEGALIATVARTKRRTAANYRAGSLRGHTSLGPVTGSSIDIPTLLSAKYYYVQNRNHPRTDSHIIDSLIFHAKSVKFCMFFLMLYAT